MIPKYLLSECAGKSEVCMGCADSVKANPQGRFYITMGHPGFNTKANNGRGYTTKHDALNVVQWLAERRITT